jgi:hypothetical protein
MQQAQLAPWLRSMTCTNPGCPGIVLAIKLHTAHTKLKPGRVVGWGRGGGGEGLLGCQRLVKDQ